jgi:ATP-dependent helicase/nuclease subunit B
MVRVFLRWRSPGGTAYNAGMGTLAAREMDAWLRDGGMVVTGSERAARALRAQFNRARRADGLTAWAAPRIDDWKSFARDAWVEGNVDGRLLLNPTQERALWASIVERDRLPATLLEGPRQRVAALAMDAHELIASHAPKYLRAAARTGWQQDAATFSEWLAAFDDRCRDGMLMSASRLPLELTAMIEAESRAKRAPLLLAGFDRILPAQRALVDAWGSWREAAVGQTATNVCFYEAADTPAEMAACALWCRRHIDANPDARLLVIAQDSASRRGEIERVFLRHAGPGQQPLFEFSLGVPLSEVPLAKGAHLTLKWLGGALDESGVDWLLATGQMAASAEENAALERYMRELRRRDEQRARWTLDAFCRHRRASQFLPDAWRERIPEVQRRLASMSSRPRSPIEWAEQVPELLKSAGWPGFRPLTSADFQTANRWQQTVEMCGSLGFDGRLMRWQEFVAELERALEETLFAPESHDAPVLIAGPAESAGLSADAIWFVGADEDTWPASGPAHPLLPAFVQRDGSMPHASPQLDWELARAMTARLIASAHEVCFSYARQRAGAETRPSRVALQLAGAPQPLPGALIAAPGAQPVSVAFEDTSRVAYPHSALKGGATVLTYQSQCPFKAFAAARLGAGEWSVAEAGLTAAQRGKLMHTVLHAVWGGRTHGIRTLEELRALEDREAFVAGHAERALRTEIPAGVREQMPQRYFELEQKRLTRLVSEWLEYELVRRPFAVENTEVDGEASIAGLMLSLRMDRVDRLSDGSLLVIDYKTGTVAPKSWELPRPDDVQLPLYAGFALDADEDLGGLVFAKLRAGEGEFAGRVRDASGTLLDGLGRRNALVRNPLDDEQLHAWREYIEKLARDFVAGRAEADPREYPETCERCGFATLCRIRDSRAWQGADDDDAGTDGE